MVPHESVESLRASAEEDLWTANLVKDKLLKNSEKLELKMKLWKHIIGLMTIINMN